QQHYYLEPSPPAPEWGLLPQPSRIAIQQIYRRKRIRIRGIARSTPAHLVLSNYPRQCLSLHATLCAQKRRRLTIIATSRRTHGLCLGKSQGIARPQPHQMIRQHRKNQQRNQLPKEAVLP